MTPTLSPDPALDGKLQTLLSAAIPLILDASRPFEARALLLMGSAAQGEASGVRLTDERFLPLSDVDLGLFFEGPDDPQDRRHLYHTVQAGLAELIADLGLSHNPLDLGLFSLPHLDRLPRSLELCEAIRDPRILAGDRQALADCRPVAPLPFEALRLLFNRITETVLPVAAAPGGEAAKGGTVADAGAGAPEGSEVVETGAPGQARAETGAPGHARAETGARGYGWPAEASWHATAPVWRAGPDEAAWRAAHRWGKLVLDFGKAQLAAGGYLEPSIRKRMSRLESDSGRESPSSGALMRDWTDWRLGPYWPPPSLNLEELAALAARIYARSLAALEPRPGGGGGRITGPGADLRSLLKCEGGGYRERIRRWRMLVACRPETVSLARAVRFALRWGGDAWPASLAALAFALYWIRSVAPPGVIGPLPDPGPVIERECPLPLIALVRWVREAGV